MSVEPSTNARLFQWSAVPREQVTPQLSRQLVSGERLMVARVSLEKGCVILHIPSNVRHAGEALEDCQVFDFFSPPREDWLNGTDSYLRPPR